MSTSKTLIANDPPEAPDSSKRSRLAGERLGTWLFAASFSVGMWGLALKVLAPSHSTPVAASAPRYALLAPSDSADGHAKVVWQTEADSLSGYPVVDGAPLTALAPQDDAAAPRD